MSADQDKKNHKLTIAEKERIMNDWEIKGRTAIQYRRIKNFMEELLHDIVIDELPLEAEYALSAEAVPLAASVGLSRKPIAEREIWGRTWESGYFKLRGKVPASWRGKSVAARLDFGGEGLVYSANGEPLYGITNGSAFAEHYSKDIYRIFPSCSGGEDVVLYVETAANKLFGIDPAPYPVSRDDPERFGTWEAKISKMRLCAIDEEAWGLYLDMRYLLALYEKLDGKSVRAVRIMRALFEATTIHRGDRANIRACRERVAVELKKPASASALRTTVVGHAHIDTAWLWRLAETRRKVARTYASQLALIERYPGYVFGASAPQHHAWIKEEHPELWKKIKAAVAAGRWEVQGGMWIESDCNLISGESMVRQFLHGKNFWMDEFGVDVRNCWIPDVFGYSAAMPQILKKSGVDYFLTQKMSWSKLNEFPHDTFRWRGLDGSEVLTHFPPEYTYNSFCDPEGLLRAEANFHEKDFLDEFITLMGIGDGGGGPKEEHVEHALRARDLEGLPKVEMGRADDFFDRLSERAGELDVWSGELYLEYHRGTYTAQARTKKNNRKLEQEIRAVEALFSCVGTEAWPTAEMDSVLKVLLLHQFHDIIPGSSIHEVYEDAEKAYAGAFATLAGLVEKAASRLMKAERGNLVLFNCLSSEYRGEVELPADFDAESLMDENGETTAIQSEGSRRVFSATVGAGRFASYRSVKNSASSASGADAGKSSVTSSKSGADIVLENELVRYRLNDAGEVVEAWDKEAGRPILKAAERGNVFSLYEDTPHNFEAWDIDYYYRQQKIGGINPVSSELLGSGPVRAGARFTLSVGKSTIEQRIYLSAHSKSLQFRTTVDWCEARRMLRVAFPLESAAQTASCDIQFGYVSRPTHANTEWDFAKFEVCAHRYVDISDGDYGVALLNDCKYGHSVRDNVIDLALLRSPLYPDPDADLGIHEFTYVLAPHSGDLVHSDVMAQAAALNRPPLLFPGVRTETRRVPITVEGEGASIEALKKAEKEDALVVRVVETRGARSKVSLLCDGGIGRLVETDLMEWKNLGEVPCAGGKAELELAPFEIKTFKAYRS